MDAHTTGVVPLLLSLIILLGLAKLGGHIALVLRQPEVLGELVAGVVLGNLALLEISHFQYLKHDEMLFILGELGVILLLFEVGLETNISEMKRVGLSSLLVGVLGVVTPMVLGVLVARFFLPDAETLVHVFIGATLCATSVGITARVLLDIGKLGTPEAKIILGAAVIDDVLGLVVLAVLSGMVTAISAGGSLELLAVLKIVGLAFGFFTAAVLVGPHLTRALFRLGGSLRSEGMLLMTALILCFGLAYLAALIGLAPIVGAFTAGLILESAHYEDLRSRSKGKHLEEFIKPIAALVVPIFFVIMGARVDLSIFAKTEVIGFALALSVAAIIGKQVCSFGVLERGLDTIAVGFGMIPRGEVGLIFAGIGATLQLHGRPLIDPETFSAVVIMVMLTTMATPPLLTWRMKSLTPSR